MIARNGVQPTGQLAWGDWCNVIGTGFGVRPTTSTGDALADAFVWVKPGGECDVSHLYAIYLSLSKLTKYCREHPTRQLLDTTLIVVSLMR